MDVEFDYGRYKVKISGIGSEDTPWVIGGVDNPSAAAMIEQIFVKNMMDKTGLDWFICQTQLLGKDGKKIALTTVGVKGSDKTRDFYFDVTEAFK
jgi:hypothetical protein